MSFYPETALKRKNRQKTQIEYFRQYSGLKFWIVDPVEHAQRYDATNGRCCFNHLIGLPKKDKTPKPLFDYEIEILNALQENKLIWIKKSRGLGVTELLLRFIAWCCLRDDTWQGMNICIVTGPRIDLAITLINRLKKLFPNVIFEDKETVCTINDCKIEAYPSHNLDAMRGLTNVVFILIDEGDYFPPGQQQDVRAVAEGYIPKSNPQIVMASTPNAPEGLYQQIELEPNSMYTKIFLPYHRGLGKIYTEEEIIQAKESPSFEREFNLAYLGQAGNVFDEYKIQQIAERGTFLENKRHGVTPLAWEKVLAIDPGYGSSKFAMVLLGKEVEYGYIETLYAEEFANAGFNEMLEEISRLWHNCRVDKIFIDGSAPELIRAVKDSVVGESSYNYLEQIKRYESKRWNPLQYFKVLPINFRTEGKEMLAHLKRLVDSDVLAISPTSFNKLIVAMRTAYAVEYTLKKSLGAHDDVLDAMLMASQYFVLPSTA